MPQMKLTLTLEALPLEVKAPFKVAVELVMPEAGTVSTAGSETLPGRHEGDLLPGTFDNRIMFAPLALVV